MVSSLPASITLYGGLTHLLALAAPAWLNWRAHRQKEERPRLPERYGIETTARPDGRLVWCHAASVGEALTLLPLLSAMLAEQNDGSTIDPAWRVLVTTGSTTSAALMAERLPASALHRYVPLDHRPWVNRFLDHWRPDFILWAESELWPNTLTEIATRCIPAVLINGRISDSSFRGWRRWPKTARSLLNAFHIVLAQSQEDADRFRILGATDVRVAGNLKLSAKPLPAEPAALATFTTATAGRRTWLAASIHPGEDAIAGRVHRALKDEVGGLLTIMVPRHPAKAADMVRTLTDNGLSVACRSRNDPISPEVDIYIADTMGELGLFYRACDIVFMGKSLAVGGGQNPAEAALMRCAIVLGPDMSNFRTMTEKMIAAAAASQIASEAELLTTVRRLLIDETSRRHLGENALAFMNSEGRAVADTLSAVAHLMAPAPGFR